jgi:hypothetical protein
MRSGRRDKIQIEYPEQNPADFGRFHSNPRPVFVLDLKTGQYKMRHGIEWARRFEIGHSDFELGREERKRGRSFGPASKKRAAESATAKVRGDTPKTAMHIAGQKSAGLQVRAFTFLRCFTASRNPSAFRKLTTVLRRGTRGGVKAR